MKVGAVEAGVAAVAAGSVPASAKRRLSTRRASP
jgi:hypothetical protein